jgi:hypothetical protein
MTPVQFLNLCKSVIQKSYNIIEVLGGELRVETKESKFTKFVFELRLHHN